MCNSHRGEVCERTVQNGVDQSSPVTEQDGSLLIYAHSQCSNTEEVRTSHFVRGLAWKVAAEPLKLTLTSTHTRVSSESVQRRSEN